jgi:protein-disulfide isomerase
MKRIVNIALLGFLLTACTPAYTDPKTPRATKGSPQAQVVIEEYADYQCPACGKAYPFLKSLQEKYGERVLWKYINFPLTSIHPYAFNAALAAECANDQGKFWEYHDKLYENQANLGKSSLYKYAGDLGLNVENFKACVQSRAKSSFIQQDIALGDKKQVNQTPTIFINDEMLTNWGELEKKLDVFFPATSTPPAN